MAKNKPLKDEEYDSIDEIQTTLDRHTDKPVSYTHLRFDHLLQPVQDLQRQPV